MKHTISWVRSAFSLRALPCLALAWAAGACDSTERLTSPAEEPASVGMEELVPVQAPSLAVDFRGGIPFGTWALPTELFGDVYNGAMRNIWPEYLLRELAAIKARGGRVVLQFAGHERMFKDSDGHFSLSMWKQRVDRFRQVNFNSYIDDGTIIGQYMIDEPNDPVNWNGRPVEGPTLEAMATYSKQIWPKMATIVRAVPSYMGKWPGIYRNLDAGWAQWTVIRGEPQDYITREVEVAKREGLKLITGLNIRKGGPNQTYMDPTVVRTAGSVLLANEYPCAFISWEYDAAYMDRADVKDAMRTLSAKAAAHRASSCKRGGETTSPTSNLAPTAFFSPPSCTAGVACQFKDGSTDGDGSIASRRWSFGDGRTSTQADPLMTFAEADTLRVTLAVTDNEGATNSTTRSVIVRPTSLPSTSGIVLNLRTAVVDGVNKVRLTWTGARGSMVDIYRNGSWREKTPNDGVYIRSVASGTVSYGYKVCEVGTSNCSVSKTAAF